MSQREYGVRFSLQSFMNVMVTAAGLPPLKELMDSFIEQGGSFLICTPCIQERNIKPEMLALVAIMKKLLLKLHNYKLFAFSQ